MKIRSINFYNGHNQAKEKAIKNDGFSHSSDSMTENGASPSFSGINTKFSKIPEERLAQLLKTKMRVPAPNSKNSKAGNPSVNWSACPGATNQYF